MMIMEKGNSGWEKEENRTGKVKGEKMERIKDKGQYAAKGHRPRSESRVLWLIPVPHVQHCRISPLFVFRTHFAR